MREFLGFRLDTVNQCVWKRDDDGANAVVRLAPKAFDVLRYLTENAGRLVTHDELLDNLWAQSVVQPAVLKSQVREVRAALSDDPHHPRYIETVPRRGYRFIAPIHDVSGALPHILPNEGTSLVGRKRPLSELHACMQSTTAGRRQIVFITGEPGIGKTALIDQFSAEVRRNVANVTCARGQCVEGFGGREPYYPMLESLRDLCESTAGESVVRMLAARAPTWLAQLPRFIRREHRAMLQRELLGATRERMLREMGEFLALLTSNTPLILVFEDLQWADNSTVDLISALSRARGPAKLLLIGTYRTAEVAADQNSLWILKQELHAHQLCREVELDPLDESDIATFLTTGSPGTALPDGLAALIHKHSEGNPLFMVSAIGHLNRRGLIYKIGNAWELGAPLKDIGVEVPDGLQQLIEARIARLSAEEQRALEVASVAGVAFSLEACAGAIDSDAERTEEVYDSLARRSQLLRQLSSHQDSKEPRSTRFQFVHAIYREVLYKRQSAGRRAKLHQRIGESMERVYASRIELIIPTLAYHFEHGGDWTRAINYLQRTSTTAAKRYAPQEAKEILEHALELVPNLPVPEQHIELDLLESLATVYALCFDLRALATYEALIARARHYDSVDVEARAQVALALPVAWTAPPERYLEVLDKALALSSRQVPEKAALTRITCLLWRLGAVWKLSDADECRLAYLEFRNSPAHTTANRRALMSLLMSYSVFLCNCSQYREALRCATESLDLLAQESEEHGGLDASYTYYQYILQRIFVLLGEWGSALKEIDSTISSLTRNAFQYAELQRVNAAWIHMHALDFSGVWEHCSAVLPLLSEPRSLMTRRQCFILAGTAQAAFGHFDRALEFFSAARAQMSEQPTMDDWYSRMPLEAGETELWIASSERQRARLQAERFLDVTLATSERSWQVLAWEANARIASTDDDWPRAAECIKRGLHTMEGFETPIASWRLHATAATVCARLGDPAVADRHRNVAASMVQRLADSLPPDSVLRRAFLHSPTVSAVLEAAKSKSQVRPVA